MSDGLTIVSGSDDTSARLWDMATGTTTRELREHTVYYSGRGKYKWAGLHIDVSA